jgi:uncharacterized protein YjbK
MFSTWTHEEYKKLLGALPADMKDFEQNAVYLDVSSLPD